jgi:hypothetical protein
MIEVKESLKHLEDKFDLKYCAIYVIPGKEKMVDYYFENVPLVSMEYFKSHHFREACFDIDGVLCADPLPEQNDDGEKYIDFILNAPLFIPGSKIGTIVTSIRKISHTNRNLVGSQ